MSNFKVVGDEIIIPRSVVASYRTQDDVFMYLPDETQKMIVTYTQAHPETKGLLYRITEYFTPLMTDCQGQSMLHMLRKPLNNYTTNKGNDSHIKNYQRLLNEVLSALSVIYDYDVYAVTSSVRLDGQNKHWDCTSTTMREWLRKNEVNKLSIQHIPIQTNLSNIQRGYLISRLILDEMEIKTLTNELRKQEMTYTDLPEETYTSDFVEPKYSLDNSSILKRASVHHSSINPLSESLLDYIGPELLIEKTPLVDIVINTILSDFFSVKDTHGSTYAYQLLISSLTESLKQVLNYSVETQCKKHKWNAHTAPFSEFRKRVGNAPLSITVNRTGSTHGTNVILPLLPMVISRTDMTMITLPYPGCNAVRRGRSVMSSNVVKTEAGLDLDIDLNAGMVDK